MPIDSFFKPTQLKRVLFFSIFDILISIATVMLAFLLRFNFDIPLNFLDVMMKMMLIIIPIKIFIFLIFRIYFVAWRFFGLAEYRRIILAHLVIYSLFILIFITLTDYFNSFPRSVIGIDLFLSLFFIGFLRISKRLYIENSKRDKKIMTMIVGANDRALQIIKSSLSGEIEYYPVALVSDDRYLIGTYFSNLKVYDESSIEEIIKKLDIEAVIIVKQLQRDKLDRLFSTLNRLGVHEIKKAQILEDDRATIKDISIEDLLARKPQDLDMITIANFIAGKVVLITGAGGSIGSELSRQVEIFGAKQIILVDHSEYNLYSITEEINNKKSISVMQSVKEYSLLEKTFKKYQPDIVIHAAAYKHVPLCENNIREAVNNNIFGTKNVIDLSIKYSVAKLVLISTDKAVRPTNVMGTTKRICELYAHAVPSKETEIVAVRFGNVLGSSGSVIPKFKSQIDKGQPITVTHPDITRYFMLIPEACLLVLQAASIAKGGELFVLDMGKPVKIADLARQMIRLYGKENEVDIEFVGLREGEKLYEELLLDESDKETKYSSIFIAKPTKYDYPQLLHDIDLLLQNNNHIEILKKIVLEFTHK